MNDEEKEKKKKKKKKSGKSHSNSSHGHKHHHHHRHHHHHHHDDTQEDGKNEDLSFISTDLQTPSKKDSPSQYSSILVKKPKSISSLQQDNEEKKDVVEEVLSQKYKKISISFDKKTYSNQEEQDDDSKYDEANTNFSKLSRFLKMKSNANNNIKEKYIQKANMDTHNSNNKQQGLLSTEHDRIMARLNSELSNSNDPNFYNNSVSSISSILISTSSPLSTLPNTNFNQLIDREELFLKKKSQPQQLQQQLQQLLQSKQQSQSSSSLLPSSLNHSNSNTLPPLFNMDMTTPISPNQPMPPKTIPKSSKLKIIPSPTKKILPDTPNQYYYTTSNHEKVKEFLSYNQKLFEKEKNSSEGVISTQSKPTPNHIIATPDSNNQNQNQEQKGTGIISPILSSSPTTYLKV